LEKGLHAEKFLSERALRMRASTIRQILRYVAEMPEIISFGGGMPDPSCFPQEEIRAIVNELVQEQASKVLQYGTTVGCIELREELLKFMNFMGFKLDGVDNVMVTSGSQQALDLLARVLIDPGDLVIVENPTYLAATLAFKVFQPKFIGIPIDDDGMIIEALEEELRKLKAEGRRVKFVYTVPTCQNPTGVSMSMERRKWLLELASQYDFLVVEDDPYSHILFKPVEFKRLKAMDDEGRVIYMGTFSKIICPGLRIGWVAAESTLVDKMVIAKQSVDLCTSPLTQLIAAEMLRRGLVLQHIPDIIKVYKTKCETMLESLEESFPEGCRWSTPVGGLFIFAYLPEKVDTEEMLQKALEKKVAYVPGRPFYVDDSGRNTMRLNYSYPKLEQIREGIARLGEVVKEELR